MKRQRQKIIRIISALARFVCVLLLLYYIDAPWLVKQSITRFPKRFNSELVKIIILYSLQCILIALNAQYSAAVILIIRLWPAPLLHKNKKKRIVYDYTERATVFSRFFRIIHIVEKRQNTVVHPWYHTNTQDSQGNRVCRLSRVKSDKFFFFDFPKTHRQPSHTVHSILH